MKRLALLLALSACSLHASPGVSARVTYAPAWTPCPPHEPVRGARMRWSDPSVPGYTPATWIVEDCVDDGCGEPVCRVVLSSRP